MVIASSRGELSTDTVVLAVVNSSWLHGDRCDSSEGGTWYTIV